MVPYDRLWGQKKRGAFAGRLETTWEGISVIVGKKRIHALYMKMPSGKRMPSSRETAWTVVRVWRLEPGSCSCEYDDWDCSVEGEIYIEKIPGKEWTFILGGKNQGHQGTAVQGTLLRALGHSSPTALLTLLNCSLASIWPLCLSPFLDPGHLSINSFQFCVH